MLLKESWVHISDNTNIRWVKIFHLYKGFHRKSTKEGYFVKSSARVVEPPRIEYKGFKYKYSVKGDVNRLLVVRVNITNKKSDHSTLRVYRNNGIIIRKKHNPKSKYLYGAALRSINRKKFLSLYNYVI